MTIPFFSDARIDALVDVPSCAVALDAAFTDLSAGNATIQARQRVDCGGVKLSTMGAVWASRQIAGVKAYTTVAGNFSFVVTLFDTATNRPAAVLEAQSLTRLRTAALTRLVTQRALRSHARKLALFGAGQQGRAQVQALCALRTFDEVAVVDPQADPAWARRLATQHSCEVTLCDAPAALSGADLVVTATRSKQPLFDGSLLKRGALVIAMGASLPDGRELDDTTLRRAARVLVEWNPQSLVEAGEAVLGIASGALDQDRIVDLPMIYAGASPWRTTDDEIIVFKSVGIGLADVACGWLALQASHREMPSGASGSTGMEAALS
ncbi:ornithine cyclodeaminase family protein [Acidovorax sp. FG27]|uniref:ornithine cyclodeaminase family protein n=1 Tax=Acidovorax sp. FG27 TaxID=3133652 RepID=UPI0030E899F0